MEALKKVGGFLAAVVLIAIVKVAVSTPSSSFAATKDWPAAVAQSKAERKPVFLVFGGPW
jgi:hypothetical protein